MNYPSIPGYSGRILEIDLSTKNIRINPLQRIMIENYLGGRGLATRLFYEAVEPRCDAFDSENVIAIATSPLLGTRAPTSCRGHMVFKSPLTGLIGSTNCGGTWAHGLKRSGYDAVVIKGKSSEPVMVDISGDRVDIVPAEQLWGMDVHQTTDRLIEGCAANARPRVLCIGPAGENSVRFASVMNDKNRAYGRGGPGAVWGIKKLKAISVIPDQKRTAIHDKEKYQSGLDQSLYLMKSAPITKRLLRELGTDGLLKLIHVIEMLPHRNFQDNIHDEHNLDKISGEAIRNTILEKAGACYGCPIACQRHTRIEGKKGEGPEYETVVMTGPDCDIYDLIEITKGHYRCNELGLDTISFGGTLACALELAEKGLIPKKGSGDILLKFGNARILEKMAELISLRKGIGNMMAEGSSRLAESVKHPEYSMTVKKMEIPAYDPRASYTQALGYMTSPTGACHLRGGYAASLAFFGGTKEIPRYSLLQSPIAIRNMQNLGIIQDSLGICRFTGFAFSEEPWARMVSGITGLDFSTSQLVEVSNRVANLERLFNLEAGLDVEEDTLPRRFQDESLYIRGRERCIPEALIKKMRSDYYLARGWDKRGAPTEEWIRTLSMKRRN